jgi:large subunit ribosomal protein L18
MPHNKLKSYFRKKRISYNLKCNASEGRIRICYHKSSNYLYLQAIDVISGATLFSSTTSNSKYFKGIENRKGIKSATKLGLLMAVYLKNKFKNMLDIKVYFDRGLYQYHGIVKACADSLRNNGLEF